MLRPVLLAVAGVAVAAVLALVVFFASEAALGGEQSPLAPREPAPAATTERAGTTTSTSTRTVPAAPTTTLDDHGRNRGRNRGKGGGSDDD